MKNFLRDVGLDSEAGLKPAGIFRNAGIFDDAGLFISTISFLSDGYYFFDPQALTAGSVTEWDGSLPDSVKDLGLIAGQLTGPDQPVADGLARVIFADNADHLDIPSTAKAGWQIVGTSLGTFAYKVDSDAITELNLLGNLGGAAYRQAGDLYGIILLPDTSTPAQVEAARQLLISRGAADGVTVTSLANAWRERADIVEFGLVDTSSVTDFFNAWRNCSSLTQFPQDALLGTEATNVDFTSAWRSSGLTSFSTPLPTATVINYAWNSCTDLTSFDLESLPLVTNTAYSFKDCTSISSFSSSFYVCKTFIGAWNANVSLADFSADVFANWNPSTLVDGCFNDTWGNCTSLTPQSVENILVSIATSGKYATTSGASGGTALTDPEIDIDYDGSGLTTATSAAIETLNGRGWAVKINGEIIVPNILQLQPAAAYSLRSFDADADPNVINVRRSSDNVTSDFTASEVSDGTLEAWVGSGNDGHVTTWYDQSGTNHATQSTASSQPKIVDAGTLITDSSGNPAIIGDGVDDTLVHPTLTNELDSSDFLVTAAYEDQLAMGIDGALIRLYLTSSSMSYNTITTIGYAAQLGQNILSFQVLGNTQEVFGNGTSLGTASETQVDIGQDMFNVLRGGSTFSNNPLMEVVVFGNDQSANRAAIETNINDYYSIY